MPGRPRPIVVVITVISATNGVVCVTGGGGNDGKDVNLGNFPLWKNDFLPSRFCNGDKTEISSFFWEGVRLHKSLQSFWAVCHC